jgi:hypothetical protein
LTAASFWLKTVISPVTCQPESVPAPSSWVTVTV